MGDFFEVQGVFQWKGNRPGLTGLIYEDRIHCRWGAHVVFLDFHIIYFGKDLYVCRDYILRTVGEFCEFAIVNRICLDDVIAYKFVHVARHMNSNYNAVDAYERVKDDLHNRNEDNGVEAGYARGYRVDDQALWDGRSDVPC